MLVKSIELINDRGFAMRVEKAIKKLKSRVVIQRIILEIENVEALAQLVRVPMHRD
jgi:putative endonuclease